MTVQDDALLDYVDEVGKRCGCDRPVFFGFLANRRCPRCNGQVAIMGSTGKRFLLCLHQEEGRNLPGCGWFRRLAIVQPLG